MTDRRNVPGSVHPIAVVVLPSAAKRKGWGSPIEESGTVRVTSFMELPEAEAICAAPCV